jgi:polyhydroxyalkanoate synthesis regulator phasin
VYEKGFCGLDIQSQQRDRRQLKMAAKNQSSGKTTQKPKAGTRAKKASARKPAAKKAKAKPKAAKKTASRGDVTGLDKSVEQFRESLEHSVTLSRDRLQEVVDDAVTRGRMTRGDAERMVSDLIKRGRRQTDGLLKELERLVTQARKEVGGRTAPVRKQATQAARRARKKLG